MTEAEFEAYRAAGTEVYLKEKMIAESISEENARRIAEKSFATLLPDGIGSAGQYLFTIAEELSNAPVGILWIGARHGEGKAVAFVYDVYIVDAYQGRGYGKIAMLLAEEEAKKLGYSRIGLHVFGHNRRARALYEKLDYQVIDLIMEKDL